MSKSKFKFKLNKNGVKELLQSQEAQKLVHEYGEAVKNRCGDGFSENTFISGNRAASRVTTETPQAYYSNAKHNTILKNLRG